MQKKETAAPKIRKDKKKNTQTGLLMGQNTNIFSQLSATYLQTKSITTQQQTNFVNTTQIIQYHQPNINRLIALLRKKADVTKVKAASQLKEEVIHMSQEQLQDFMPTFSHLFMQIIINQQSKQVTDEFYGIINHLLINNKKIVIKQIATIFGPLMIINKCNNISQIKTYSILFRGTQQQLHQKALILLLNKNVLKKFLIFCRVIIECEQIHKIGQQNFQKNCSSILKILKQLIKSYQIINEKKQQIKIGFTKFIKQINEIVSSKFVQQYFNVGGKAKSSFLQFYQILISSARKYPQWEINWENYAKIICQHYLDKDAVVQHSLWKYCNKQFIQSTLEFQKLQRDNKQDKKEQNKEKYWLLLKNLPKPDEKLLSVLKIGGQTLYKQLPSYCTVFPYTLFEIPQTHKAMINKISFIRKLMQTLLQLQDQNQFRIQCYYQLSLYLIKILRNSYLSTTQLDQRKQQQIKTLSLKAQKQIINNLQDKFYKQGQTSRNSFGYYIPTYFCKLIEQIQPNFDFVFNAKQVFPLYCNLTNGSRSQYSQTLSNKIYENCKGNQTLLLQYLQNFPSKQIPIDMQKSTTTIQLASKIFILSKQSQHQQNWFKTTWNLYYILTIFDPRINLNNLQQIQQQLSNHSYTLNFIPNNKDIIYDKYFNILHDLRRFKFFIHCLQDQQHIYLIPYLLNTVQEIIMKRNTQTRVTCINKLLQIHQKSIDKFENNQWIIGQAEVLKLRVIDRLVLGGLKDNEQEKEEKQLKQLNKQSISQQVTINQHLLDNFLGSYCLFLLAIHNYKLQSQVEELFKLVNKTLDIPTVSQNIFNSARKSLKNAYQTFTKVGSHSKQLKQGEQKQRKNRLTRLLNYVKKALWYAIDKKKQQNILILFEDIFTNSDWKYAEYRPDLWLISGCMLEVMGRKDQKYVLHKLVYSHQKYQYFLTLLMCCQLVLSLQRHLNARKMFVDLQVETLKEIQENAQQQRNLNILSSVIRQSIKEQSFLLIFGGKNLLKNLMKNYKNLSPQIIDRYLEICLQQPIEQLKKQQSEQGFEKKCFLIINLCSELPLLDFEKIDKRYEELLQLVKNEKNNLKILGYFALLATMWQSSLGIDKINNEQSSQMIKKIIEALKQVSKQNNIQKSNFGRWCSLIFFNCLIQIRPKQQIKQCWDFLLMQVVWVSVQQGSLFHGVLQSVRFKFISRMFSSSPLEMKAKIAKTIPEQITKQIKFYKEILDQIQDQDKENQEGGRQPHFQNIVNMFIQFAEVLVRITGGLSKETKPQQQTVLEMLQCPFPGIKKTAFMLLKQMYELSLVDRNPPAVFLGYLKFDSKQIKPQLDPILANTFSSYLYSWQAIIQRRGTMERAITQDEQGFITLQDYLQNGQLHEIFLKNVFQILQTSLQYTKNEQEYYMTPQQLIQIDLIVAVQDDLNIMNKMFRLTIRTLFMFIQNFPIFLRNFMDRNKKYKTICDRLLRNVISDAIFKQQVKKIEIRQHEWKISGNFQIYVTIKNKQIYAQYIHDAIRIGLRLTMKGNYPLTPISIQFGEGLKIDQGGRWALMLQNQLCSRNNTIIMGILLWKENIDKKLAGVEECTICFDIVNAQGQLPKKGCKTCKKKFHNVCVLKWFSKSNKSECPHCKSQFL